MHRTLLFTNEAHYIRWRYPTLYEGHFRSERKAAHFEKATRYVRQAIIEGASNDEALLSIVKSLPVVKMTINVQQFIKHRKAGSTSF